MIARNKLVKLLMLLWNVDAVCLHIIKREEPETWPHYHLVPSKQRGEKPTKNMDGLSQNVYFAAEAAFVSFHHQTQHALHTSWA